MRWDDRQRAMLAELGIRGWAPAGEALSTVPAGDVPGRPGGARGTAPTEAAATGGPLAAPSAAAGADAAAGAGGDAAAAAGADAAAPAGAAPAAAAVTDRAASPVDRSRGPGESAARAAGLDWPALREAVATCTACALCEARRQPVFGAGRDDRAHWLFVGDPPGDAEDAQGEPTAGRAGQLFDNMLRALGLSRDAADPARRAFVANVVRCRPAGGRAPTADELAACAPFIARQIELLQPRVVVAMGALAVQGLTGSREPLGKLRGRVYRCHGVPLVVTYAPVYLLRQAVEKPRAWDDLRLAAGIAAEASPR